MSFGTQLKALRKERGWTQGQVAESLGLSIIFISDMERGRGKPGHSTFIQLAELFGVDLNTLADVERPNATSDERISNELRKLNLDELTPMDALTKLYELKRMVK